MLSKELEITLNDAFKESRSLNHEFMTVEHLLYSLTRNESACKVLKSCGADIDALRNEVKLFVDETTPILHEDNEKEIQPTLGFQRVLQRAVFNAQSRNLKEVKGENVLEAIFNENESQAVFYLLKQNIDRSSVVKYLNKDSVESKVEAELEEAFEKQYDRGFDYKNLLRLKDKELEAVRDELEKVRLEKEKEIQRQLDSNVELSEMIRSSELVIKNLKNELGGLRQEQKNQIIRSIEFRPEHRQAGLSILGYFAEIVEQKYPDKNIRVSIEQVGNVIKLTIQTEDGDEEIINKTLDTYGLVVMGKVTPDKLLCDPIHVAKLESKLDLSKVEIRSLERLLKIKDDSIFILKETFQTLTSINKESQKNLNKALKKIGGNREVYTAIKLIESLSLSGKISKEEISEVEESVRIIYTQSPGALEEVEEYFLNVSSSMVGSIVLNTIKMLGVS